MLWSKLIPRDVFANKNLIRRLRDKQIRQYANGILYTASKYYWMDFYTDTEMQLFYLIVEIAYIVVQKIRCMNRSMSCYIYIHNACKRMTFER